MFFYTPEKAFDMIEKYGEAGRAIYLEDRIVRRYHLSDYLYVVLCFADLLAVPTWI